MPADTVTLDRETAVALASTSTRSHFVGLTSSTGREILNRVVSSRREYSRFRRSLTGSGLTSTP